MAWLCKILHLNRTEMVTSTWHYKVCRLCGRRVATRRMGNGYGPVDRKWLDGKTDHPVGFDIRFRDTVEGRSV